MGFVYKSLMEQRKMSLEEVEEYYRQLRKYEYEQGKPIQGIEKTKKINDYIIQLLKLERYIEGRSLTILRDDRIQNSKSKIYVVTHIGRYDIEMAMEAIKESCYLIMGDPGETYRDLDGLMLKKKGVLYFDTRYSLDRKIVEKNSIEVLDQGGNIFIFPEGAWNTTPNEIVTKLYKGVIRMASPSEKRPKGSDIIPIALEQYGLKFYGLIGKNIDISKEENKTSQELIDDLRDILCTLKFDIWKQFPIVSRNSFPKNYENIYVDNIMAESSDTYTLSEIERTRYHDKMVTFPKNAFSFLEKLTPTKENAFLWKDTLVYKKQKDQKETPLSLEEAIRYIQILSPTRANALLLGETVTFINNQNYEHKAIPFLQEVIKFMGKLEISKEKAILLRQVYAFIRKLDLSKEKLDLLNEISTFIMEIKSYHISNKKEKSLLNKQKKKGKY